MNICLNPLPSQSAPNWKAAFVSRRLLRTRSSAVLVAIFGSGLTFAASTPTLPYATVTGVTATSPVVRSTPGIAISALVTTYFDTNPAPSTATTCNACNNSNNYCGTGNAAVKSQQVVTTTTTTVTGLPPVVNASPEFGAANPTIATLTGSGLSASGIGSGTFPYSGTLPTQLSGDNGFHNVTVTAYVSEQVSTSAQVTTKNMGSGGCGGALISSTTVTNAPSSAMRFGSGNASGTYLLDINAPGHSIKPDTSQPQVKQGNDHVTHSVLTGGSPSTNYSVITTATGPNGVTYSAQSNASFGGGVAARNGMASDKHVLIGVHMACDAPIGTYTATATANTADLVGQPFNPVQATNVDTFDVTQGIFLEDQTFVVSELPPDGDYAPMACFSSTQANQKVTSFPGSLHVTATVNTTGPCAGFGSISGTSVSLTLPAGFSFADNGGSPKAHVFIGPAASGFDYHYPQTLAEVTGLLPKSAIVVSGQTATVDLSALTLDPAQGPGVIPASDTIYVRAHAAYSDGVVPADGNPFIFTTTTTSTLPGIGVSTASDSRTVTASSACVNGNF